MADINDKVNMIVENYEPKIYVETEGKKKLLVFWIVLVILASIIILIPILFVNCMKTWTW